jgi:8-amino-3,8-dideoxy-alpha-D-manno-octulosonate transaminase
MPGPGWYLVGEEEKQEVLEVLESGHVYRYGDPNDPKFKKKVFTLQQEFAKKIGVKHCVAVSGGTAALMASMTALGIGRGDEVLMPGYTFVASMSSTILVGARPVFTEMDESFTMDPKDLEHRITSKTKAIMPVHILGNPCDMDPIMEIARKHDLFVIEDACQALGASYKGKMVGSFGDMGAFSLNAYKTITSGDGGLLTTNNTELFERAFGFQDQGYAPKGTLLELTERGIIGINLRMNELTGAFALGQLKKLDTILQMLKEKKAKFNDAILAGGIKNIEFRRVNDPGECHTLLVVIFPDAATTERIAKELDTTTVQDSGWHVYSNMAQILNYTDADGNKPYHKDMLPRTDDLLRRSIALSVGVVDRGLGAAFGINILSSDEEIQQAAEKFITVVKPLVD